MLVSELVGPPLGMLYGLYIIRRRFGFTLDFASTLKLFVSAFSAYLVSSSVFYVMDFNPWLELVLGSLLALLVYLAGLILLRALVKGDINDMFSISDVFGPLAGVIKLLLGLLGHFVNE
jgi:hypothetical protein